GMHRHTHIPRPGRTDTHAHTLFSFLCGRRGRNVSTHRAARSPHTELMPNHTHTHTHTHTRTRTRIKYSLKLMHCDTCTCIHTHTHFPRGTDVESFPINFHSFFIHLFIIYSLFIYFIQFFIHLFHSALLYLLLFFSICMLHMHTCDNTHTSHTR